MYKHNYLVDERLITVVLVFRQIIFQKPGRKTSVGCCRRVLVSWREQLEMQLIPPHHINPCSAIPFLQSTDSTYSYSHIRNPSLRGQINKRERWYGMKNICSFVYTRSSFILYYMYCVRFYSNNNLLFNNRKFITE